MNNKLINVEGFKSVMCLIKADINSTNNNINNLKKEIGDDNVLKQLKEKTKRDNISDMISSLYTYIANLEKLPTSTVDDEGKVFGITLDENSQKKISLIDINKKINEIVENIASGEIKVNTNWDSIQDKPKIASKLDLNDNGLHLIDTDKETMSSVNVISQSDVDVILNNIDISK